MQVTPVVKTYRKRDTSATAIMPNQITAVKAYGICSKCNNVFDVFMSHWARNGFKCSYCKTKLDYVKAAWRKVPSVVEGTDLAPYFTKFSAKYPTNITPTVTEQPKPIEDNTAILVAIKRNNVLLEQLHKDNEAILIAISDLLRAWR